MLENVSIESIHMGSNGSWLTEFELHSRNFKSHDHRLLLIDDDTDQLVIFTYLLQSKGFYVESCTSASEGIEKVKNERINLVITDLKMPGLGGDDFVRNLRSYNPQELQSDVPVIILTSCETELELDLLKLGADMFCRKDQAWKILVPQIKFLLT